MIPELTDEQKTIIKWILTLDERVVPPDEGHGEALQYNLVMSLVCNQPNNYWTYKKSQSEALAMLAQELNVEYDMSRLSDNYWVE